MPRYNWEGRTATGSVVRGELEAPSREAVLQSLGSRQITVTKVDERQGGRVVVTGAREETSASSPTRNNGGREAGRRRLGENLWIVGVVAFFGAFGVGAAWIDPFLFYDCARQVNGSVDCTVHRRMYGVIPLGDLHFSRILSVDVHSGVHSETMAERARRLRIGGEESSYEVLELACADGTRWQSPQSSSPLGQTLWDHRLGIQGLLDASAPETYRGWTADKVTLTIATVFWAPLGFILLGLVLRLVTPRWAVEALFAAAERARAKRLQGR
jgi:hypothetical protein